MHRLTIPWLVLLTTLVAAPALAGSDSDSGAHHGRRYEVRVTNLTQGQTFTPILLAQHRRPLRLFELGAPASRELEILAEDGDTAPISTLLERRGARTRTRPGLLEPGGSARIEVVAGPRDRYLSLAAMLIPTNDTFFAATSIRLPRRGSHTVRVPAYDAGTEENDQRCANMPGPRCGGQGHSPRPTEGDEGFVFIGNGFHELGLEDADGNEVLGPAVYDWRNPVARVTVRRIR